MQLGGCSTMSTHLLYPRPGNRDGSSPISQRDHQQLMCKTHFRTIHNQFNLLKMGCLLSQHLLAIGSYQEHTSIAGFSNNRLRRRVKLSNLAEPGILLAIRLNSPIYFGKSNDQPSKIPYLCNSLPRSQFHYLMNPGIIELVGRIVFLRFVKWLCKN